MTDHRRIKKGGGGEAPTQLLEGSQTDTQRFPTFASTIPSLRRRSTKAINTQSPVPWTAISDARPIHAKAPKHCQEAYNYKGCTLQTRLRQSNGREMRQEREQRKNKKKGVERPSSLSSGHLSSSLGRSLLVLLQLLGLGLHNVHLGIVVGLPPGVLLLEAALVALAQRLPLLGGILQDLGRGHAPVEVGRLQDELYVGGGGAGREALVIQLGDAPLLEEPGEAATGAVGQVDDLDGEAVDPRLACSGVGLPVAGGLGLEALSRIVSFTERHGVGTPHHPKGRRRRNMLLRAATHLQLERRQLVELIPDGPNGVA